MRPSLPIMIPDHARHRRESAEARDGRFALFVASFNSRTCPEKRKQIHSVDEGDFFMELIRDVATELDIDVLCHKILINVCLLTYADRGSLFLARGPPDKRYLVAKLFDVTVDTGK